MATRRSTRLFQVTQETSSQRPHAQQSDTTTRRLVPAAARSTLDQVDETRGVVARTRRPRVIDLTCESPPDRLGSLHRNRGSMHARGLTQTVGSRIAVLRGRRAAVATASRASAHNTASRPAATAAQFTPKKSKLLPNHQLAGLPNVAKSPETIIGCPVCFTDLMGPNAPQSSVTECGHLFCQDCINQVFVTSKHCPSCRKVIQLQNLRTVYLNLAL